MGAIALAIAIVIMVGITAYLIGTMIRSIQNEKRTKMRLWKNFGLSLGFCLLFLLSWAGHGIAEWQEFTDVARDHKETPEIGDFAAQFSAATLENWQSEFLQLFSFTVMAAVLIHKGSAESKDGSDRVESALRRIETKLGTTPTAAEPEGVSQGKDLHVVQDENQGWALIDESSSEPEGYFDTQEEAIDAGRTLSRDLGVALIIHGQDGKARQESSPS
jgi:Uncharacterized protein conserved in bacteria (DUF2188)